MGYHTKTVGIRQGVIYLYVNEVPKIVYHVKKGLDRGLDFESARQEALKHINDAHGFTPLGEWMEIRNTYGRANREELLLWAFPELTRGDARALIHRARKEKSAIYSPVDGSRRGKDNKAFWKNPFFAGDVASMLGVLRGVTRRGNTPSPRRGTTTRTQARRSTPRAVRTAAKAGDDGGGSDDGDGQGDSDGEPPRPLVQPSASDRAHNIPFDSHNLIGLLPSRSIAPRCWRLAEGRCAI